MRMTVILCGLILLGGFNGLFTEGSISVNDNDESRKIRIDLKIKRPDVVLAALTNTILGTAGIMSGLNVPAGFILLTQSIAILAREAGHKKKKNRASDYDSIDGEVPIKEELDGDAHDLVVSVANVVEVLFTIFNTKDIRSIDLDNPSYLQRVFSLETKEEREKLVRSFIKGEKDSYAFFQELFSVLLSYTSEKLAGIKAYLYDGLLPFIKVRSTNKKQHYKESNEELYLHLHEISRDTVSEIRSNSIRSGVIVEEQGSLYITDLMLSFVPLIAGRDAKAPIALLGQLVNALYDIAADEDSLKTFIQMSSQMEPIYGTESAEERTELVQKLLEDESNAAEFLDEILLQLHLYLQDKLSDIFASLLSDVSAATKGDELDING